MPPGSRSIAFPAILAVLILFLYRHYGLLLSYLAVTIFGVVLGSLISQPGPSSAIGFRLLRLLAIGLSPLYHLYARLRTENQQQMANDAPENPEPMVELWCHANPEIDIVAIHGLDSRSDSTWTHPKSDKLWLRDFLPDDVPPARIMTFRHNSRWQSESLDKELSDHGVQLLNALERCRNSEWTKDRPLLLIGYSFGGLIIKQALIIATKFHKNHERLVNSLAGVVFLGTPHSGSLYAAFGYILAHLKYWNGSSTQLLGVIEYNSEKARKLEHDFSQSYKRLPTKDFFETKYVTWLDISVTPIVPKASATRLGYESEPLDVDHYGLNKFENKDDAGYRSISATISTMANTKFSKDKEQNDKDEAAYQKLLLDLAPYPQKKIAATSTTGFDKGIFETEDFQGWVNRKKKAIFVFGPERLKIASFVRQKYGEETIIDFSFQSTTKFLSLDGFYQTILHQLLRNIPQSKSNYRRECLDTVHKWRLATDVWKSAAKNALHEILPKMAPVLLIVDSLDECHCNTSSDELSEWLLAITQLPGLKALLTSGRDPLIESLAKNGDYAQLCLDIDSGTAEEVNLQDEDTGIKIWHDPAEATIDICFVHGLSGDRTSTWTATGQLDPWPKAFLPAQLSTARILTYGYDIYLPRGSAAQNDRLIDHAQNLMSELTVERERTDSLSRHIIFVAHSLGGLLCKEAIRRSRNHPDAHLRNIFECVKGIIFMGTPHEGSWTTKWGNVLAKDVGLRKFPNKSLLAILATENSQLESIQIDFRSMIRELRGADRTIEIMCYYEQDPMPWLNRHLVSRKSATFEEFNCLGIRADHCGMVKFESTEDRGFRSVLADLVRWTKQTSSSSKEQRQEFLKCLKVRIDQIVEKDRIEDRAGGLVRDAYTWILKNETYLDWQTNGKKRLLWLKGDAGKGKTMLICGIINTLMGITPKKPLAFFFCQAANFKLNNASAVLRGLIFMILDSQPHLISDIQIDFQHSLENLPEDGEAFFPLKRVMKAILEHPRLKPAWLVIDALDECLTNLDQLLGLIQDFSAHEKIKWVVSSRNVVSIGQALRDVGPQQAMVSLELNQDSVSASVATYIASKVEELSRLKRYDDIRKREVKEYLSQNADNTFLWVALVCQNLRQVQYRATERMKDFPPGLKPLYQRMLEQAFDQDHRHVCRPVLRHVLMAYEPLALSELVSLTVELENLLLEEVKNIVQLCGSFLTLRADRIYFVHQSAKDFLLSTDCVPSVLPQGGIPAIHHTLLKQSLTLMGGTLKYNMCRIRPGTPVTEVTWDSSLHVIRYPCMFWTQHACDATKEPSLFAGILGAPGEVFEFLKRHLLHWFEYLALVQKVSDGLLAIRGLSEALQVETQEANDTSDLRSFLDDVVRFLLTNRYIIDRVPLQIYGAALAFSPHRSIVRQGFWQERLPFLKQVEGIDVDWTECLQTMMVENSTIRAVAFSSDGKLVATASDNGTLGIWDVAIGVCQRSRSDYNGGPIAFSTQEGKIAYPSTGGTIVMWDLSADTMKSTLSTAGDWELMLLDFSEDGSRIAATFDRRFTKDGGKIELWAVGTGSYSGLPSDSVIFATCFAPSGKSLAASTKDGKIQILRIPDLSLKRTLSCDDCVYLQFSQDSRTLTSLSMYGEIRIWTVSDGLCQEIDVDWRREPPWTSLMAVGRCNGLIAVCIDDACARIYDLKTREMRHFQFSGNRDSVGAIAVSANGKMLAFSQSDKLQLWNISGRHDQNLENKINEITDESQVDGVAFSQGGKLYASWLTKSRTIQIWDAATGSVKAVIDGATNASANEKCVIALSPDGKLLALAQTFRSEIEIWELDGLKHYRFPWCSPRQGLGRQVIAAIFLDNKSLALTYSHTGGTIFGMVICNTSFRNRVLSLSKPPRFATKMVDNFKVMNIQQSYLAHEGWNVGLDSLKDTSTPCVLVSSQFPAQHSVNWGPLLPKAAKAQAQNAAQIFVRYPSQEWVTVDGEDVLWLPPDYRAKSSAVHNHVLLLGHSRGRITRLHFNPSRK